MNTLLHRPDEDLPEEVEPRFMTIGCLGFLGLLILSFSLAGLTIALMWWSGAL